MARVGFIYGVPEVDAASGRTLYRSFVLPNDIPWLEKAIQRKSARLVVIDPLMSFLDGAVNSWRDQDVRAALAPLAALAERTGAAILILRHLNKATGMSAIHRGGGSVGIIGAARSGLLVAKHPDNPDQERVLTSIKSNLGASMPSLRYQLTATLQGVEGVGGRGYRASEERPCRRVVGGVRPGRGDIVSRSADGKARGGSEFRQRGGGDGVAERGAGGWATPEDGGGAGGRGGRNHQ